MTTIYKFFYISNIYKYKYISVYKLNKNKLFKIWKNLRKNRRNSMKIRKILYMLKSKKTIIQLGLISLILRRIHILQK